MIKDGGRVPFTQVTLCLNSIPDGNGIRHYPEKTYNFRLRMGMILASIAKSTFVKPCKVPFFSLSNF